ncbi:MAG: hypothetical protein AB7P76_04555 [Candidatus Melainabacteria bacterium]
MSQSPRRRAPGSSSAVRRKEVPAENLYAAITAVERYSGLNVPKSLYRQQVGPSPGGPMQPPPASMHMVSLLNTVWLHLHEMAGTIQQAANPQA